MKSLKVVQGFAKVGRILSLIFFIFAIIGVVSCAVGLLLILSLGGVEYSEGVTLAQAIENEINQPIVAFYASMICSLIVCGAEIVVAKMAQKFFEYELKQGTPFTYDCANKMLKLGIWCIILPLIAGFVCAIVYAIYSSIHGNVITEDLVSYSSFSGVGLAFIVVSFILKYGADVKKSADLSIGIKDNEVVVQDVPEQETQEDTKDKDVFGK